MLGYSMGGAITCEIALRKRIPLEGMVLLSSGADLKSYTPLVDGLKQISAEKFDAVATWKAIPDSQLFMIPYKGHAVIYEEQKLVTEKIKGFLRKL